MPMMCFFGLSSLTVSTEVVDAAVTQGATEVSLKWGELTLTSVTNTELV